MIVQEAYLRQISQRREKPEKDNIPVSSKSSQIKILLYAADECFSKSSKEGRQSCLASGSEYHVLFIHK